mmetsp:Transcript_14305/g.28518  ORF Transcript_14305/g.28518 Transcript_14305/m.28518 type:complete len:98 (+) Transcript_14305:1-294(+)
MARRCGASLLIHQLLSPLLARTPEEYSEIARRLGQAPSLLRRWRARVMAHRIDGPLFDTLGWVKDFERMLRGMWDTRDSRGDAPGHPRMPHIVLAKQ